MDGSAANELAHRPTPPPTLVTVVESLACHFCDEAHTVLTSLAEDFPIRVDFVDARSQAGRALMTRHRAAMSPLVLVDGVFFSNGRLPRRKLTRNLAQRYGAPASPTITPSAAAGGPHG